MEIVSDHSRMKKDSGGKECQSAEKTESYKQEEMCQVCEEKKKRKCVCVLEDKVEFPPNNIKRNHHVYLKFVRCFWIFPFVSMVCALIAVCY